MKVKKRKRKRKRKLKNFSTSKKKKFESFKAKEKQIRESMEQIFVQHHKFQMRSKSANFSSESRCCQQSNSMNHESQSDRTIPTD
jgi:hypothetical protein